MAIRKTFLFLLFTSYFMTSSCKADDDSDLPPVEQLPEATQEGLGTFGCLVNGEPFIETGTFFNTFYQEIEEEFFFGLTAEFEDRPILSIFLGSFEKNIEQGETYQLTERVNGNTWGAVFINSNQQESEFVMTNSSNPGTMTITTMDFKNGIISGTFSFSVIDPFTNEPLEITDGRFDTLFTQ